MKPERWQQLDELFHSALGRAPAERAAFLDDACAGDESLRKQVEALLAAHVEGGSFIENPALQVEARSLAMEQDQSAVGKTIGHYKVISSIGVGGMGEVYLAQDIKLGRKVALKLLPAGFTQDTDRVRRFQQEARAASALNHPNIITIYEIGQDEERHFIATEFIDGVTLRQRLGKGMQPAEVLMVGMQVADALAAAHAKGIVHRDIKPENIILVEDSHLQQKESMVKVLDFGIAKLTESHVAGERGEATTKVLLNTYEGSVLGTASYMSPEQARGEKVDARTDIWSLGILLYEMLTKEAPFGGDTAQDVIASILKEEPPEISGEVPDRLKWIVEKALRKDKEERYQTAREMFSDLRMLHKLENERTVPTRSADDRPPLGNAIQERPQITGDTAGNSFLKAVRRHTGLVGILLVISIIAALGAVFGFRKLMGRNRMSPSSFQTMSLTGLTRSGKVTDAAISPDGKFVVHVVADGEQQSLWIKQVSSPDSELPINGGAKTNYVGLTFSPSGNDLFYTACDNKLPCVLYRMSMLGRDPRKLITDVDSSVSFSPDGKQFAYLRGIPPQAEVTLLIANVDGTGEREIVRRNMGGVPAFVCSWSPDGKVIVYPVNSPDESGNSVTLVGVQVADSLEKPISSRRWAKVDHLAWVNDGSGLVLTGRENHASPSQVWFLSYPGGQVHKITNDLKDYVSVSLTADSATLVTVDSEQVSNIWIAPYDNARDASQITGNKFDGVEGVTWTPDGRIIYASRTGNGKLDLWKVDANGKEQKQLTADQGNNRSPSVSADGRYVTFVSDRTGSDHIWRIDIEGSNARQLTYGVGEWNPQCSPNSDWVFYNLSTGKNDVWKVSIQGGEPVHIVDKASGGVAISRDGKWIAAPYHDPTPKWKTGIYPTEGGEPNTILDIASGWLSWTPDGGALVYLDNVGDQNLNIQPIAGGPPKRFTNFTDSRLFSFAISADGKRIAVARGTLTHDVMLIKDFRVRQ